MNQINEQLELRKKILDLKLEEVKYFKNEGEVDLIVELTTLEVVKLSFASKRERTDYSNQLLNNLSNKG